MKKGDVVCSPVGAGILKKLTTYFAKVQVCNREYIFLPGQLVSLEEATLPCLKRITPSWKNITESH